MEHLDALRRWWRESVMTVTEVRPEDPLVTRVVRGLISVDARDRVLILAGQAFIALMPLLIVLASVTSSLDGAALGRYFVQQYELTGDAEEAVTSLFSRPPEATSPVTVGSLLILLFSVNSFSRAVRRTLERAWNLPPAGVSGAAYGLLGVLALVTLAVVLSALSVAAADEGAGTALLLLAVELAVAVPGWLLVTYLFLARRHHYSVLVPGAIFGAVAHLVAVAVSSVYLPWLFAVNAERYGAIGVAFSLVAWLVVFAVVIVAVGVVSAELARPSTRAASK